MRGLLEDMVGERELGFGVLTGVVWIVEGVGTIETCVGDGMIWWYRVVWVLKKRRLKTFKRLI